MRSSRTSGTTARLRRRVGIVRSVRRGRTGEATSSFAELNTVQVGTWKRCSRPVFVALVTTFFSYSRDGKTESGGGPFPGRHPRGRRGHNRLRDTSVGAQYPRASLARWRRILDSSPTGPREIRDANVVPQMVVPGTIYADIWNLGGDKEHHLHE